MSGTSELPAVNDSSALLLRICFIYFFSKSEGNIFFRFKIVIFCASLEEQNVN